MKRLLLAMMMAATGATLLAKDSDRRLAVAKTAFVEAGDPLSDDRPIAACLTDHLVKTTTLTPADSKDAADIILTVYKSNIAGESMRSLFGSLGLARIDALLPDGTKLWHGYENLTANSKLELRAVSDVPCMLADALADKLRQGMRKARDKK